MLAKCSEILGTTIRAADGDVGSIRDIYFDDLQWTTRYFAANTGTWLTGRQVLLSPSALRSFDRDADVAEFDLSRGQIENSPSIDEDQPVSRQHENAMVGYYGWPAYWTLPAPPARERWRIEAEQSHLRSARHVSGYYIHAADGDLGHVEDFLLDPQTWEIRYLVVDTRNWWPGKKVLVSPEWIQDIDWGSSTVKVDLTRDEIRNSPEYDPSRPVETEYEEKLRAYHRRPALRA